MTRLWPVLGRAVALDLNALLPVGLIGALSVLIVRDLNAPESVGGVLTGAFVAFSMGWGWTGQAFALALRTFTENPGSAASVMQSGGMAGSALGPFLGAAGVHFWGLQAAWILAASASVLGGLAVLALPSPAAATTLVREGIT